MKIVHVLSSNKYSGAENVVCQIIEMFRDEPDIEMIYCSPDGEIRSTLNERNISFYPIGRMDIFCVRKMIKELDPDIIHAHDYRAGVISSLTLTKKTIINHLHSDPPWIRKLGMAV